MPTPNTDPLEAVAAEVTPWTSKTVDMATPLESNSAKTTEKSLLTTFNHFYSDVLLQSCRVSLLYNWDV